MKGSWLGIVLLVAVVAWKSGIVNSAAVVPNGGEPREKRNPASPLKYVEQTMEDYVELAEAFYAPAPNDAVREKRTLNVVRNLVNRTRSGFSAVRSLLQGSSGSGSSSSGSGTGGFRARIGDLFTRVLTFFTRLWDRITGLFNRGGDSGSGGSGPFARLRTTVTGLFARFTGGGGGGGGLGALFGRTTTTESYPDFVYTPEEDKSSTTSTTEKAADFPPDSENDFPFHDATKTEVEASGGYEDKVVDSKREGKDMSASGSYRAAQVEGGFPDFVPFPGESDPDIEVRSANPKAAPSPSLIPLQRSARDMRPYVVNSPEVLHLVGGQRLVVVQ